MLTDNRMSLQGQHRRSQRTNEIRGIAIEHFFPTDAVKNYTLHLQCVLVIFFIVKANSTIDAVWGRGTQNHMSYMYFHQIQCSSRHNNRLSLHTIWQLSVPPCINLSNLVLFDCMCLLRLSGPSMTIWHIHKPTFILMWALCAQGCKCMQPHAEIKGTAAWKGH